MSLAYVLRSIVYLSNFARAIVLLVLVDFGEVKEWKGVSLGYIVATRCTL